MGAFIRAAKTVTWALTREWALARDTTVIALQFEVHCIYHISSNLAAARFYFKAPFGATTIRGQLDFKGGVYRNQHARVRIHIMAVDLLPCGEISRAAFIGMSWQKHAATFRGQRDFEVRRDFEEIATVYENNLPPQFGSCLLLKKRGLIYKRIRINYCSS